MAKADKNGLGLIDASFCPHKLKTFVKMQFASKVILFKETWSSKMP
jgi:hypothetical protein